MKDLYVHCFIACLIGNIIHLAIAYAKISKDYKVANLHLGFRQYVKNEMATIIADLVASLGLVYIADEWLYSEYILEKIKTAFVLVGGTGSYLIMWALGKSKSVLQKTVDEKTNIADFGTSVKPTDPK